MAIVPQNPALCMVDFEHAFPSTPGIYVILNRVNEHLYVGSAVNLIHRKRHHLSYLSRGQHKNPYLQRAYDAYGSDAFLFGVIEQVEHADQLLAREQYYLDTLNPEYNIARTAGSNLGLKTSPETREKMRAARVAHPQMLLQMEQLNAARRGKHLSPEHRAKITANQLGKKLSPEQRAKMSAAHRGRKKPAEAVARSAAARRGKKRSAETIAKVSAARRGKPLTAEHRAKIGAAHRGRKHSAEAIEKMRVAKLGKKNSPEARAKMSASRKGKKSSPQTIEKLRGNKHHLGHTHSPEAKAKMRAASLGRKQSAETFAKRMATQRANRERRKAEQQIIQLPLF